MGLKKFRPVTPTLRHTVLPDFAELTRSRPVKSLTERLYKTGGRDNKGHVSARWIGGGHKRRYRLIDFRRDKDKVPARVAALPLDLAAQLLGVNRFHLHREDGLDRTPDLDLVGVAGHLEANRVGALLQVRRLLGHDWPYDDLSWVLHDDSTSESCASARRENTTCPASSTW